MGYNTVWSELCEGIRSVVTYSFHDIVNAATVPRAFVCKDQSTAHTLNCLCGLRLQCVAVFCACVHYECIGNSHGSRGSHGIPMGMGITELVLWEWEWLDGNGKE